MVISLVNNVEFYSHLRSSGYLNGVGRTGQVRINPDASSTSDNINQTSPKKTANEKIGSGVDSNLRSKGIYIDILHPQYTRQSPVSKAGNSFKSALESALNRPEFNARIYSKTGAKQPDTFNGIDSSKFGIESNIQDGGFVITVPGEHLDKLNENRTDSLKNKLYDIYNNRSLSYSGSLVNVTA